MNANNSEISLVIGRSFTQWITNLKTPKRKSRKTTAIKLPISEILHPQKVDDFRSQRKHFRNIEEETVERLKKSISRLCRGQQIVKNSLKWENPQIGTGRTVTDKIRGEQWQLVMAWSGLEMIIGDLENNIKIERIEKFLEKLNDYESLCKYDPIKLEINPIKIKKHIEIVNGQIDIIDFLDVTNKETKEIFARFFQERDPLTKPHEGLALAKSLRHMIAHGALSPSKVNEWGLRPLFNRLTTEIGQITALTFETLNGI